MSKYMRSRMVPLMEGEPQAVREEMNEFVDEVVEAGQRLKYYREEMGLQQEELASHVGVNPEYIDALEKGEKLIPTRLAKQFGEFFHEDFKLFL